MKYSKPVSQPLLTSCLYSELQARNLMKEASSVPNGPGAWKWRFRKQMWDKMEAEDIARQEDHRPLCI